MKKIRAFTLAETLITLLLIGVVAAITIPALMQQINNETLKGQRIATGSKLAKGFAQMKAEEVLQEKYSNTAEFVEKMKNYFQITQVCDSNNLTNCFVGTVITQKTENNETVNTENNISEINDKENIMGLRFSDGTSMLIKYNPDSPLAGAAWTDNLTNNGMIGRLANKDSYPTYSDLFYYVVDVNNAKSPNTKGKDIVGNLVLEKGASGTDFGLGFVIIDDTMFIASEECPDSYDSPDDNTPAAEKLECLQNFCKKKGGRVPTADDMLKITNALFDNAGENGYSFKENYNRDLLNIIFSTNENSIAVSTTKNGTSYCASFFSLMEATYYNSTWSEYVGFDAHDSEYCSSNYVPSNTFCIK